MLDGNKLFSRIRKYKTTDLTCKLGLKSNGDIKNPRPEGEK